MKEWRLPIAVSSSAHGAGGQRKPDAAPSPSRRAVDAILRSALCGLRSATDVVQPPPAAGWKGGR